MSNVFVIDVRTVPSKQVIPGDEGEDKEKI